MLTKVQVAEEYVNNVPTDPTDRKSIETYRININKAIELYKEVCLNPKLKVQERYEALISFLWHIEDEGKDVLSRLRDMLPFLTDTALANTIELLVKTAMHIDIDVHERLSTAVNLYNRGILDVYPIFISIASDTPNATLLQRTEACRYLVGTEDEKMKEIAQECLLEIIEDDEKYTSSERYGVIGSYITNRGLRTVMNNLRIQVHYDETFVYALQFTFFSNTKNNIRDRILSGQHLLGMELSSSEEKKNVVDVLLQIARDATLEENTRADAADVVLRLGGADDIVTARALIKEIGYSSVSRNAAKILNRVQTFYNDSQNVHEVEECINIFAEKMATSTKSELPFEEVRDEVIASSGNVIEMLLKEAQEATPPREFVPEEARFRVKNALHRIAIDTATFGKYKVTVAEIFTHVYMRICEFSTEDPTRQLLERLMIEELIAMDDTCSSGHAARFILVLSIVDGTITIGFDKQLIANIAGRMASAVDKLDDDTKGSVSLGMMDNPDEEELKIYLKFLSDTESILKKELYDEFVGGKYLTEDNFNKAFEEGMKGWRR